MSEANDLEVRDEHARDAPKGADTTAPVEGAYTVRLPMFEGPLDLLLHLCQKHELNILEIPIAFITEKYLEYLAVMQLINLDVAAEYLLMAATLAHIKSKMLLPAPPPGQEEDDDLSLEETDPREALIRRLLEYQKYKEAAEHLAARGVAGRDVFFRGAPVEEAVDTGVPPLAEVPLFSLVEAFQRILAKSKIKLTHDIVADRVSLSDRIHELADLLAVRKRVLFEEIFLGPDAPRSPEAANVEGLPAKQEVTRFDLVITFLALLEMTRLRMTRLFQEGPLAPLYVELAEATGTPHPDAPPQRPSVVPTTHAADVLPIPFGEEDEPAAVVVDEEEVFQSFEGFEDDVPSSEGEAPFDGGESIEPADPTEPADENAEGDEP